MPRRRIAFIAAAICASGFVVVMGWGVFMEQPHVGGSQICARDAASARVFGAPGPGAYTFDRNTGGAVPLPVSLAATMVLKGIFNPTYSGQAACGITALTQTAGGLVAAALLLGLIAASLVAVLAGGRA